MMNKTTSVMMMALLLLAGCKASAPASSTPAVSPTAAPAASYPARPSVAPPAFKVFHHDASSVTLVTKEDASDEEIESLVWELRDAAHAHSFDKLKIDQRWVDARDPMMWFHIYRGAKCASEKYTTGKLPCDASYHAAGDYTFGGFTNKEHDDGVLRKADGTEVHLWDPDKAYAP